MQLNELIQRVLDEKRQNYPDNERLARRLSETGGAVYKGRLWTGEIKPQGWRITESAFDKPGEPVDGWSTHEADERPDAELARESGFALASEITA